jgi:hypothetical protein
MKWEVALYRQREERRTVGEAQMKRGEKERKKEEKKSGKTEIMKTWI